MGIHDHCNPSSNENLSYVYVSNKFSKNFNKKQCKQNANTELSLIRNKLK